MRTTEKNLLLAVRNQLRTAVGSGGAGFASSECDVEDDVMAPAVIGHRFVCINTLGWQPGPYHGKSGGINDLVYSVEVTVIRRAAHIARDRKEGVFYTNTGNLCDEIDLIYNAIDWNYTVTAAAETLITAAGYSAANERFHPLVFTSMDPKPRVCSGEMFGGQGANAGLMRSIRFGGARRITVKS